MIEPSASARRALAPRAIEFAYGGEGSFVRATSSPQPGRRETIQFVANPLRGKACNSGWITPATLAPNAEPDLWEEY